MQETARPSLPRPLRKAAGALMQRTLNRLLRMDPDAQQRLDALEGQSVQMHLLGPDLAFRVHLEQGALRVGPPEPEASLRVRATPGTLLALALDRHGELPPGRLDIAGDAGLARQLEGLLKRWQPDLEAAVSARLGDVLGVPVARAIERGSRAVRRGLGHAREDTAAWLRDEARLTPSRAEVDDFLDGVDSVRERGDRLAQRLSRLERSR